jgi:hypothetical protein
MKRPEKRHTGYLAWFVLLSFPIAGCGGDPEDVGDSVEIDSASSEDTHQAISARRAWWRRHRSSGTGGTGTAGVGGTTGGTAGTDTGGAGGTTGGSPGAAGSGTASDCDLCAKAQECCLSVSGGALCQYSAAECSSMSGAGRQAYIDGCKVLLTTTSNAWNAQPPSACR